MKKPAASNMTGLKDAFDLRAIRKLVEIFVIRWFYLLLADEKTFYCSHLFVSCDNRSRFQSIGKGRNYLSCRRRTRLPQVHKAKGWWLLQGDRWQQIYWCLSQWRVPSWEWPGRPRLLYVQLQMISLVHNIKILGYLKSFHLLWCNANQEEGPSRCGWSTPCLEGFCGDQIHHDLNFRPPDRERSR